MTEVVAVDRQRLALCWRV